MSRHTVHKVELTPTQVTNRRALITALRSGTYHQGAGRLVRLCATPDGGEAPAYCCLGVAGRVVGLSDATLRKELFSREDGVPGVYLSKEVLAEFGFTYADQQTLAMLNDDEFSFHEIARIIEIATDQQIDTHEARYVARQNGLLSTPGQEGGDA